ncbi:hypothetical protein PYW08_015111 [Mythimna loreyi]|uniref:Uncharacterized protein n=1 Tax=Mythimna loreyi TaxID=667449 RepID=A0ACC2QUP8_9NEOP|nr:hypothetical protein PYW08_015111 [Mythimna loreyi]
MTETEEYKCVNCGTAAAALYRTYGPSVLKLTKCDKCKEIVDKYIEYDPVIVMIDLVLMSREAQRHILYNTEFKAFWKLAIILIMLEAYGVWRSDSLFSLGVNSICGFSNNSTNLTIPINISQSVPDSWKAGCWAWSHVERNEEDNDLFIWEKDFYVQFSSITCGILMFVATAHLLMTMMPLFSTRTKVPIIRLLKTFTLADVSILFTLPMLVWGSETSAETRTIHFVLVYAYSFVVFLNVFSVIYECPVLITSFVILLSNVTKNITCYHATPIFRRIFAY